MCSSPDCIVCVLITTLFGFALGPVEVEIPGAMREHFSAGFKTKDPRTSLVAIQDTTVKIRQADGRNVLIEQNTKELFPPTRFFLMNGPPLQELV